MSNDEVSMYREQLTLLTAQMAKTVRERDDARAKLAVMGNPVVQASTPIASDLIQALKQKVAALESRAVSQQEDLRLRVEERDALIAQLDVIEKENAALRQVAQEHQNQLAEEKKKNVTLHHENETQFTSLARLGSLNVELKTAKDAALAELATLKVAHAELEKMYSTQNDELAHMVVDGIKAREAERAKELDWVTKLQKLEQDNIELNTALTKAGATAMELKAEQDKTRVRLINLEAERDSLKNAPNSPPNEKSDVTPGPVVVGAKFQRQRKKKMETLVVERIDKSQVFCSVEGTPNSGSWYHHDVIAALPALKVQN